MTRFFTKTSIALTLLVLVAVVSLGLLSYQVIAGQAINQVVLTLLATVTGFLGNTLGNSQGAENALSIPPGVQGYALDGTPSPTAGRTGAAIIPADKKV